MQAPSRLPLCRGRDEEHGVFAPTSSGRSVEPREDASEKGKTSAYDPKGRLSFSQAGSPVPAPCLGLWAPAPSGYLLDPQGKSQQAPSIPHSWWGASSLSAMEELNTSRCSACLWVAGRGRAGAGSHWQPLPVTFPGPPAPSSRGLGLAK